MDRDDVEEIAEGSHGGGIPPARDGVVADFGAEDLRGRIGGADRRASDRHQRLIDAQIAVVQIRIQVRLVPDAPQRDVALVSRHDGVHEVVPVLII